MKKIIYAHFRVSEILTAFVAMALLGLVFTYHVGVYAQSPVTVDLGETVNFALLSKVSISNTASSDIVGDIGVSPNGGSSITGIECARVDGNIHVTSAGGTTEPCQSIDPTYLSQAIQDMESAYADATSRTPDATTDLDIGGQTFLPGVYTTAGGFLNSLFISSDVTLDCSSDADGVFIFQVGGDLFLFASTHIVLNGCAPENIFWAVAGTTNLQGGIGTESALAGTVLAGPLESHITLAAGATVEGRLLGQNTITLNQNTITNPTAGTVIPPVTPTTTPTTTPTETPTTTPTTTPTETPTTTPTETPTTTPTETPTTTPTTTPIEVVETNTSSGRSSGGGSSRRIQTTSGFTVTMPVLDWSRMVTAQRFTFIRDLTIDNEGPDVTALQNRLREEGVYTGPITGYFGPLTERAVRAYQEKMSILNTGYVGVLTKAKLNEERNGISSEQVDALRMQLVSILRQMVENLRAQMPTQ